jgi:hypothetical protein
MAEVATPEFIAHLKSLYPEQPEYLKNEWYIAAAVAFSASNLPEAVPIVFRYALKDLEAHPTADLEKDSLLLVRKIKDAVFKSAMLSGFPKVSGIAWYFSMPILIAICARLSTPWELCTELYLSI